MERHLSSGVTTIVALMAAARVTSGQVDALFDAVENADLAAEPVPPRDEVGDWLLSLAPHRRQSTWKKLSRRKPG